MRIIDIIIAVIAMSLLRANRKGITILLKLTFAVRAFNRHNYYIDISNFTNIAPGNQEFTLSSKLMTA